MVRMDYVFNDVVFQKMFRNKVENLETSGTDLGNKKMICVILTGDKRDRNLWSQRTKDKFAYL